MATLKAIMPKRKRAAAAAKHNESSPMDEQPSNGNGNAPETFSLMDGKLDLLQGLVLHRNVISPDFESQLITFVQTQCEKGRRGELKKPTYLRASGARSQGNQREAIMYGGFFDFNRARPGKRGLVPPFPPLLNKLVDHLVFNGYLPKEVRPDSCIINRYDVGDCIPPHVDHKSYYRPISTLSLLGEEPMLVGSRFRTVRSCTWEPTCGKSIPLARRSLLVLGGNSGSIAKHCVSSCKGPRISITLRKQPPPDWRPDESELVKGKKRKMGNEEGNHSNKLDCDEQPKKKKALSGSAKRRKKMMKHIGMKDRNDGVGNSGFPVGASGVDAKSSESSTKKESNKKKESEKQARRNARRLEKKKAIKDAKVNKA